MVFRSPKYLSTFHFFLIKGVGSCQKLHGKCLLIVSLTRRPPFTRRKIPGTHFCYRLSRPQDHCAAGRIRSIEKSNHLIGNQTDDLPACSTAPQPTQITQQITKPATTAYNLLETDTGLVRRPMDDIKRHEKEVPAVLIKFRETIGDTRTRNQFVEHIQRTRLWFEGNAR
jgi:hypothetical protein